MMTRFGRLLRESRSRLKTSQRELAAAVGVDHTYLSKLECGHMQPSAALTERLAKALDADPRAFWAAAENTPTAEARLDERERCARELEFLRDCLPADCSNWHQLNAAAVAVRSGALRYLHGEAVRQ